MEISEGGGGEKPDFSRSENVALCLFTSKAMAVLRWFLPRENSDIIERAIKLKILAIQFVCRKSVLKWGRVVEGADPYMVVRNFWSFPSIHKPNNLFFESSLVFGRSTKTFFISRKGQKIQMTLI